MILDILIGLVIGIILFKCFKKDRRAQEQEAAQAMQDCRDVLTKQEAANPLEKYEVITEHGHYYEDRSHLISERPKADNELGNRIYIENGHKVLCFQGNLFIRLESSGIFLVKNTLIIAPNQEQLKAVWEFIEQELNAALNKPKMFDGTREQ